MSACVYLLYACWNWLQRHDGETFNTRFYRNLCNSTCPWLKCFSRIRSFVDDVIWLAEKGEQKNWLRCHWEGLDQCRVDSLFKMHASSLCIWISLTACVHVMMELCSCSSQPCEQHLWIWSMPSAFILRTLLESKSIVSVGFNQKHRFHKFKKEELPKNKQTS